MSAKFPPSAVTLTRKWTHLFMWAVSRAIGGRKCWSRGSSDEAATAFPHTGCWFVLMGPHTSSLALQLHSLLVLGGKQQLALADGTAANSSDSSPPPCLPLIHLLYLFLCLLYSPLCVFLLFLPDLLIFFLILFSFPHFTPLSLAFLLFLFILSLSLPSYLTPSLVFLFFYFLSTFSVYRHCRSSFSLGILCTHFLFCIRVLMLLVSLFLFLLL